MSRRPSLSLWARAWWLLASRICAVRRDAQLEMLRHVARLGAIAAGEPLGHPQMIKPRRQRLRGEPPHLGRSGRGGSGGHKKPARASECPTRKCGLPVETLSIPGLARITGGHRRHGRMPGRSPGIQLVFRSAAQQESRRCRGGIRMTGSL